MINKQEFTDTYQYYDKSVIVEIIDLFIDECPDKLAALEQNIKEANFDKLRFNTHSLKGVVANFSAPPALEKIKELEKMAIGLVEGKENRFNKEDMLICLAAIKEMIYEVMNELQEIKEEYK